MINWNEKARKMGYDNPKTMIADLYYVKEMSLEEVADKLIVSRTALTHFMDESSFPRRNKEDTKWIRGGPKCPDCGEVNSRVLQTFPGDIYYRYRICRSCKRRFMTKEIVEDTDGVLDISTGNRDIALHLLEIE